MIFLQDEIIDKLEIVKGQPILIKSLLPQIFLDIFHVDLL